MRNAAIPLTIILATGCDWLKPIDPCAGGSPLQQDPNVSADCQACGQSPCPDETGETGDEPVITELTCDSYAVDPDTGLGLQYCFVGHWDIPITNPNFAPYIHKTKADCPQLSAEFPCDRTWHAITANHAGGEAPPPEQLPANGDSAGTMCVLCQAEGEAAPKSAAPDNNGWRLCPGDNFLPQPHPAADDNLPNGTLGWLDNLTCSEYTDPGYACPLGFVALDQFDYEHTGLVMFSTFTCACHGSDDTCQPGAVCEAGWTIDGEDLYPSLCTWDDGSGGNGFAPQGPVVYGLAQWSDGLTVDGDEIMLSPSMLLALLPHDGQPFALLNDDQRIDTRGTITHCGAGSLCEHLGLHVGERLVMDRFDVDELLGGGATYIEVVRPRTRSRWLAITLD